MLRTSIYFLLLALVCFLAADIQVTTFDPWQELQRFGLGLLTPDFAGLPEFWRPLANTVSFALIGIVAAVGLGSLLSLFFEYTALRLFCSFIRSIHEIFWAFLLMPITGLNSLCGVLAIAIPYAGVFAKVYAEIRQEADTRPAEVLPEDASRISIFFYATLPGIYQDLKSYTSYRFECALRSSAILGFIGLPTLGYHLETAFREGMYSEAAALLYAFYLLIISIRFWAQPAVVALLFALSLFYTALDAAFSVANVIRFFTYDILPWPMRAEGFYAGTGAISFDWAGTAQWALDILGSTAIPGLFNTLILTQIALVLTAIFTMVTFPFGSRNFYGKGVTGLTHIVLVVLRTTPEYILAYIFLQLWGPSMLPAIFALFLHNGAILSYLTARNVNLIQVPFDASPGKLNRYLYEVLPRCYGQFLAFLFYRWEVIMRESAILGILGVATLGHYIDSAIAKDHIDTALFLIVVTALLNMAIDTCSQLIRKRLKISAHLQSCTT